MQHQPWIFSVLLLGLSTGCPGDDSTDTSDTMADSGTDTAADTMADDDTTTAEASSGGSAVVFATDIYDGIIVPNCAGAGACHITGMSGGLEMPDAATAQANLVGVDSVSEPGIIRVVAGDPAASYLVAKLNGTQAVGSPMPLGSMLTAEEIQLVSDWITDGAAP